MRKTYPLINKYRETTKLTVLAKNCHFIYIEIHYIEYRKVKYTKNIENII